MNDLDQTIKHDETAKGLGGVNPLVVIRCLTYNHEPYIRDCLEGFVMQKTNFPFVAIVHDDASTDHTADIVREYAEKYPDIIHPIFETENQYSKRDGSLGRIMNEAIAATGCKYIAMCEGDDYWIDPLKLQRQVEFLEEHEEYAICFHDVQVWDESKKVLYPKSSLKDVPEATTILDLAEENYIHTPSVMYRYNKEAEQAQIEIGPKPAGDYIKHMLYAEKGKIKKMTETMAVYRSGVGVWSTMTGIEMVPKSIKVIMALMRYFTKDVTVHKALSFQLKCGIEVLREYSLNCPKAQKSITFRIGYKFAKKIMALTLHSANISIVYKILHNQLGYCVNALSRYVQKCSRLQNPASFG